jgi:hypothetical protein
MQTAIHRICQLTGWLNACLLLQGCHSFAVQQNAASYPPELRIQSQTQTGMRQIEAQTHSLAEKAAIFERRIFGEFRDPNHFLFGEERRANRSLQLDLEATALVLAATAAKYSVTQAPEDLRAINRILDGLQVLDDVNTRDGFLPHLVESPNLKVIRGDTHANAYAQLMFAYITVHQQVADDAVHAKIRMQAKAMAGYFLKHQFKMHDAAGQPIEVSDLTPSPWQLSRSRVLDLLLIAESLRYLLPPDDPEAPELKAYLDTAGQVGYLRKIQCLRFQMLGYKVPTHSSDWLNFLRLYTLTRISDTSDYHSAWKRHYQNMKEELNPFYAILHHDNSQKAVIEHYMNSFPLTLDNHPVVPDDQVPLNPYPLYKKNNRAVEALTPLPIYQRPASNFEWKRNPYRVEGHLVRQSEVKYAGIDFYIAYWFGRQNGLIDGE